MLRHNIFFCWIKSFHWDKIIAAYDYIFLSDLLYQWGDALCSCWQRKREKKNWKGFIWMVITSASICTLSALKSLRQKLHGWDFSKNDPLSALSIAPQLCIGRVRGEPLTHTFFFFLYTAISWISQPTSHKITKQGTEMTFPPVPIWSSFCPEAEI